MRAIQESVAKSRQAALERTLQRQAEEQAAKEVHIAAANVRFETQRKIKGREAEKLYKSSWRTVWILSIL